MKLSNYRSNDLKKAIQLLQERETLLEKLQKIESELDSIGSNGSGSKSAIGGGKRAPRGALKEAIIAALTEAGPAGLSPKDLAASLGVSGGQVNAWLASTGKTVKEIKRVGRGKYHWTGK